MRRLELEAKMTSDQQDSTQSARKPLVVTAVCERVNKSAQDELQLREELRHARLLADTYQARTLELERLRLDMDEEVSRMRFERENDSLRQQKTENEVRRLRSEVEAARSERAWVSENKRTGAVRDAAEQALRSPRSRDRGDKRDRSPAPEYRGASHPGLDYRPGSRTRRQRAKSSDANDVYAANFRRRLGGEEYSRGTNDSLTQEDSLQESDDLSNTHGSVRGTRTSAVRSNYAASSTTSGSMLCAADVAAGTRPRRISAPVAPVSASAFGTSSGRQLHYPGTSWVQSTPLTPKPAPRQTRGEDQRQVVPRVPGNVKPRPPNTPKSSTRSFGSNRGSPRSAVIR